MSLVLDLANRNSCLLHTQLITIITLCTSLRNSISWSAYSLFCTSISIFMSRYTLKEDIFARNLIFAIQRETYVNFAGILFCGWENFESFVEFNFAIEWLIYYYTSFLVQKSNFLIASPVTYWNTIIRTKRIWISPKTVKLDFDSAKMSYLIKVACCAQKILFVGQNCHVPNENKYKNLFTGFSDFTDSPGNPPGSAGELTGEWR